VRFKAREVEKAYTELENRLKRPPSDPEIAEELGLTIDELNHTYSQLASVSLVALDELMTVDGGQGDKLSLVETLEDTKTASPSEAFEGVEMKEILTGAINRLPEREKIVITLYYYEGLTLAEIGQVLGVTESRVCQMHTKAVLALKGRISEETSGE
jgi:RNA polymerase sigma factor for flagellar operon FliA